MYTPLDRMPYLPITDRPRIKWPNDARVAFWVAPNVEHYDICRPLMENEIRGRARPIRMCRTTHISITGIGSAFGECCKSLMRTRFAAPSR